MWLISDFEAAAFIAIVAVMAALGGSMIRTRHLDDIDPAVAALVAGDLPA